MSEFKEHIDTFPTYQGKAMTFYDIGSLTNDPEQMTAAIEAMRESVEKTDTNKFVGLEARGWIFASPLSVITRKGLILMRKPGKLPGEIATRSYGLEYGKDTFEIQPDRFKEGDKVVIVDDVVATGGTTIAAIELIQEETPAKVVGVQSFIDLAYLSGAKRIEEETGVPVSAVITYEEDPTQR